MSRPTEPVGDARLRRATRQARTGQLLFVALVPVACFVAVVVTHASSYEDGWWPTIVVPALLVVGPAAGLFLSWTFHQRLSASGLIDRRLLYPSVPPRLAGISAFVLEAVLGVVVLLAAAATRGHARSDLTATGTATVSLSIVAALLWMLGSWLVTMSVIGDRLSEQDPAVKGPWLRVLSQAPAALVAMAILTSFAVPLHNVPLLVVGVVALTVCLAGTVLLGLRAGYQPPGGSGSARRWHYYVACVVGLIAEVAYVYSLWQRPR